VRGVPRADSLDAGSDAAGSDASATADSDLAGSDRAVWSLCAGRSPVGALRLVEESGRCGAGVVGVENARLTELFGSAAPSRGTVGGRAPDSAVGPVRSARARVAVSGSRPAAGAPAARERESAPGSQARSVRVRSSVLRCMSTGSWRRGGRGARNVNGSSSADVHRACQRSGGPAAPVRLYLPLRGSERGAGGDWPDERSCARSRPSPAARPAPMVTTDSRTRDVVTR
jgi:hypothetical protein